MTMSARYFRFGPFEADLRARELRLRGQRVELQDKPFEILATLLQRTGDIVLREELYDRLWPDQVVEYETNLSTAVAKLRKALGDMADDPKFIETLPKRGYRLLVPVRVAATPDRASSASGRENRKGFGQAFFFGSLVAAVLTVAFLGVALTSEVGRGITADQADEEVQPGSTSVRGPESFVVEGSASRDEGARDSHDPRSCPSEDRRSRQTSPSLDGAG